MRVKKVFEIFCGILLFLGVTVNMTEIISRVFFKLSIDLFFDFSIWLTVWAFLLMAGIILPEGGHVAIDAIRLKFKGLPRRILETSLALITFGYGILITWGGIYFIRYLYQKNSVLPRYFQIPQWTVEVCVPISMFIFTIYAGIEVVKAFRKKW